MAFFIYQPGLSGGFLFDDFPSLSALGNQGQINNWEAFRNFVFGGSAGPTGRPLSLLSFLIDDNTWPSVAAPFKYTSLCLHLITGLLLVWAIYLLLCAIRFAEQRAAWVAVLAASFWLLHPYWVSTTLYVVQRMTILSSLFMLAGMVTYLKGRLWLMQSTQHRPWAAYILMTVGTGLGTLLAVLSKENGALLPLLLLVLELFLHRMRAKAPPHKAWLALVLGVPALVVVGYLAKHINFSSDMWPSRPFNQVERLYSEARIMWDYVGQLWLPRIEGAGLYQDGFVISRSLTQPISTLWAVLAWGATLLVLPFLYKRLPFIWLAAVFFLCGHLIESTVIGLELHFEHRNYAPAFFMFLPLAIGIDYLWKNFGLWIAVIATTLLWSVLASMTWQRSQLWSDNNRLQTYWAMKDPLSARGRNYLTGQFIEKKNYEEALAWADQAVQDLPQSSLLTLSWLRLHINLDKASEQHFQKAARLLSFQPFDAQAVAGLRTLVTDAVENPNLSHYHLPLLELLENLNEDNLGKKPPVFRRVMAYNKARLYMLTGDLERALGHYTEAMQRYGRADSAMQMFAEMAQAGHLREANQLLQQIEVQINNDTLDVRPLGKIYFQKEVTHMQAVIASDLENN